MRSLILQWHEFSVNLSAVEAWLRDNAGGNYTGNVASDALTLYFTSEPADATVTAIQNYWDGLTAQSPEATSYVSRQSIEEAIADLRATMINKAWDDLTVAERKLLLGQTPTLAELGLA